MSLARTISLEVQYRLADLILDCKVTHDLESVSVEVSRKVPAAFSGDKRFELQTLDLLDVALRGFDHIWRKDDLDLYVLKIPLERRHQRVLRWLDLLQEEGLFESYRDYRYGEEIFVVYQEDQLQDLLSGIGSSLPELRDLGDYPHDSPTVRALGYRKSPGPGKQERMFLLARNQA